MRVAHYACLCSLQRVPTAEVVAVKTAARLEEERARVVVTWKLQVGVYADAGER